MLNFMMKCLVSWGTSWASSNYRFIFFNSEKISSIISFIAFSPLFFCWYSLFWNSYFRWQTLKNMLWFSCLSLLYFLPVFKKTGGVDFDLIFPSQPSLNLKYFGYFQELYHFHFEIPLRVSCWHEGYAFSIYLKVLIITLISAVWSLFLYYVSSEFLNSTSCFFCFFFF